MSTQSHKLGGSAAVVFDYLKDESATLKYYDAHDGSLAFDRVWGKAAADVGIERGISRQQFVQLFHGRHPDTGEQLAKSGYKQVINPDGTVEAVETRTPMIDVVYGAPKSVAVLYVSATPELRSKLDEVMLNAAHAAFNAMEETGKLARVPVKTPTQVGARTTKQQGSQTERVPADLIALPVIQYTARHTEESLGRGVPDPQIHVHVPFFTLCKAGERWYTADEAGIKTRINSKHRDAVFMGELARGLEQLGVELDYQEFDRAKGGEVKWEVKGTDEELRRYWSTNNEKAWRIRREYEEEHSKPIDEKTLREIMYETRMLKSVAAKQQDSHPNWDLWRSDARRAGFKLGTADERSSIEHNVFRAADTLSQRLLSANGLCIDDAVFDEASIRPAVARCGVGLGFSPEELDGAAKALMASKELVLVRDAHDRDHRLWTTQTMLEAEKAIAKHRDSHAAQWVDITGRAGTGKSRLTATAVETIRSLAPQEVEYEGKKVTLPPAPIKEAFKAAIRRQDVKLDDEQIAGVKAIVKASRGVDNLLVVSLAASTAERTGQKVKADAWGSVESVVSRVERGALKIDNRTLVIIEEAGQLDTLRTHKLLKAVKDARIVTLGDTSQLSAIGGGGWYADALQRHRSIELTEVRRQKSLDDVRDLDLIRSGRTSEALARLEAKGRMHWAPTDEDRMGQMFQTYKELRDRGAAARQVAMIFDGPNTEVDAANRFVDRDRLRRGEISRYSVTVEQAETGRRWELHENDRIIMLETVRVRGRDPIKNGTVGVIKHLDMRTGETRIKFQDGREMKVPTTAAIGRGDAVHIQRYQGGEVEIALNALSSGTSRNSAYTMQSRGTIEAHMFASVQSHGSPERLGQMMQRIDEKETAHAVLERARQEEIDELLPVRSDELILDDITLDPVPELAPVRKAAERDPWAQRDPWQQQDPWQQREMELERGGDFGIGH